MSFIDAILPTYFLFIGVPCLLIPRKVQSFVISFNARFGCHEAPDSFRRSEKYVIRLRNLGAFTILAAAVLVLLSVYGEDIARAVI